MKSDKDKGVYKFNDGYKNRRIDILAVLSDVSKEISFAEMENVSPNDIQTISKLVAVFRKALKIPEFKEEDEESLTDSGVAYIVNDFISQLNNVKKNSKSKPISQNVTEQVL